MFRTHSRIISAVVLFFFTWTSGGLFSIAHAAVDAAKKVKAVEAAKKQADGPEERLAKLTGDLEDTLADPKAEVDKKRQRLSAGKTEIETLDVDIRKQFAETEKKLKDAKLSTEIMERHRKFVKHYDDNLAELKGNIERVEKAKDNAEAETELRKVSDHLNRVKAPSRHQKLDPNNLPHRQPKAVKREPRMKKEEFEKDLNKDKHAWKNQKRIQVASAGSLAGLLTSSVVNAVVPPTAADLAETVEVQFTPEIKAKALELGNNPVKIYEWVRNNIEFVPTWGSIQGAQMTMLTKQGNAFDTASLLISLLRASGIHARYVTGTIELPIEKIMNWAGGFTDPQAALTYIASGGVPIKGVMSGGKITKAQLEHVWVKAWIDYIPSRGAVQKQGNTWIPLDSSIKQYSYKNSIDVKGITGFDASTFTNRINIASTVNSSTGSVKNVPTGDIQNQLNGIISDLSNYIDTNMPNATVGDVFGGKNIVQQNYRILPASLPCKVIVPGNETAQITDNLRHKIALSIGEPNGLGQTLNYSTYLSQIASKKLTLSYMPSTEADAQLLAIYGHYNVKPYLVKLKPVLYLEGEVVASGDSVGMGETQDFSVTFTLTDGSTDQVIHKIPASSFASIGLDLQKTPYEQLTKRKAKLDQALNQLGQQEVPVDDVIGEILNLHSLAYFYQLEIMNRLSVMGKVAYSKQPAEMLTTLSPNIRYLYGIPYSVAGLGMKVDVKKYAMTVVSLSGDLDQEKVFMLIAGHNSSALEHAVFEQFSPDTQGVSAVKIISEAMKQGIPIYEIDSTNSAAILPHLQITSQTLEDISNAITSGKKIYIPERTMQYFDWRGEGYIVIDPATGAGAYMISGGLAGGGGAQQNSILPVSIDRLLQSISFGTLREAFRQIAAETPGFSPAVSSLRQWSGPMGVLITAIFAGLNMANDTNSSLSGVAAFSGTLGLGCLATATLGFLLPGLGIFTILIAITAVITLTMILQSILMDYIRATSLKLRRRYIANKLNSYRSSQC